VSATPNKNTDSMPVLAWVGFVVVLLIFIFAIASETSSPSIDGQLSTDSSTSSTTSLSESESISCNGISYSSCPLGTDFVCPGGGGSGFCRDPLHISTDSASPAGAGYSALVSEWKKRVAKIECTWKRSNGTPYLNLEGSAVLVKFANGLVAITNKHVIVDENGYSPSDCVVGIYDSGARAVSESHGRGAAETYGYGSDGRDWGLIQLGPTYTSFETDDAAFDTNTNTQLRVCSNDDADVGDQIIILGYPSIGTAKGVTVTDGIVSGVEPDFYVTNAKIDHGNSGGAAVLVKEDCYLGIPTWVANNGGFESLGRILKSTFPLEATN
jgi:hypothetical protein